MAPTVTDAATNEGQTNKEIADFLQLASEFNKVDAVATRQKKVDYYNKLFDDIQDEPDRREEIDVIKTEDIFFNDDIFSDTNPKNISNLNVNDISFKHVPIDTASNVPPALEPRLDFSNIFLRNNKVKYKAAKKNQRK